MAYVSEYIIKIVCATVLCGIINHIVNGNGTVHAVLKTISGIFIALTVLSPFVNFRIDKHINLWNDYIETGTYYAMDGELLAKEQKSEYIKTATQSYILDKAISLGAELEVEVVLFDNDESSYEAVLLKGEVSPYVKKQLSLLIEENLGIPEEAQQWIS